MTAYRDKKGRPLCEMPEGGRNYTRCKHIAISLLHDKYKCLWFDTILKETAEGWLAKCDECAQGKYESRKDKPKLKVNPTTKRTQKVLKKRPFDRETLNKVKQFNHLDALIYLLQNAKVPVVKTKLISTYSSMFWPGFATSQFIHIEGQIKCAFNKLVECGIITFVKGKPLILNEDKINEASKTDD